MNPAPRPSRRRKGNNGPQLVERLASLLLSGGQADGTQAQPPPGRRRRNRRKRRRKNAGMTGATPGVPAAFVRSGLTNSSPTSVVVSGVDWIESLTISPSVADGDPLFDFHLAPWDWPGTHANLLSRGYERFRILRLNIELSSRSPTSVGGGFVGGISPDPEFRVFSPDPLVSRRRVRSLAGSISANWWQTVSISLPRSLLTPEWRFTSKGSDLRLCSFGQFLALVDGPPSGVTANTTLRVVAEVSWTMEFSGPISGSGDPTGKFVWKVPANELHSPPDSSDDKWIWKCDKGTAQTMWDSIPFESILYATDGTSAKYYFDGGTPNDRTDKVYWFRKSQLASGNWALVPFESDDKARASKPNPSRDVTLGQVRVKGDQKITSSTTFVVLMDHPF